MPLFVKRLTETATIPTRATVMAAGLDLYADESRVVRWRPGTDPDRDCAGD